MVVVNFSAIEPTLLCILHSTKGVCIIRYLSNLIVLRVCKSQCMLSLYRPSSPQGTPVSWQLLSNSLDYVIRQRPNNACQFQQPDLNFANIAIYLHKQQISFFCPAISDYLILY